MIKFFPVYTLFLMLALLTSCGHKQKRNSKETPTKGAFKPESNVELSPQAPNSITRTIVQDRQGIIWIATFQGVFRYDGKAFTNFTKEVSSARFFSVLEDRKGNLWFGSIGSGIFFFDGKTFQNFTNKDGLLNNEVTSIYEDKSGNIWFGVNGGASRLDGDSLTTGKASFQNFILSGDSIVEDSTGKTLPDFTRPPNEVTSIIEDKTGKLWVGTRGNSYFLDSHLNSIEGKTFTTISHNGKPFKNVRTIIEDSKGNIWLGGNDGLWRYDGISFTNFSENFVGYIIEDEDGNIWTSSEGPQGWVLSQYDEKSLTNKTPATTEINTKEGKMLFGILEAKDGSIWFGSLDGVYRYETSLKNGKRPRITHFQADSLNQF